MKLVLALVFALMLSGCSLKTMDLFEPKTKVVHVKVKSKPIVKTKTKVVTKFQPIPVPSQKPEQPKKLDIDANLVCPSFDQYPDPTTLTPDQVVFVLQELKKYNDICKSNMEEIRRKYNAN